MADATVVREFLVKLGFAVDLPGQTNFINGVIEATKAVAELAAGSIAAAGAVVLAISKMAGASDDLYFISQRTRSSASSIQAFGYAAAQMGSSVEAARASLEGLASWERSNPGAKGLLQSLGVNPQASTTEQMTELGARFARMPTYLAQRYAGMMGIDQNTMRAMIAGMGEFTTAYLAMQQKAGVNGDAAALAGHKFMLSLRELGAAFDILGQKAAISLYKGVGDDIKRFTALISNNFQAISDAIVSAAKFIVSFADTIIHVVTRIKDLFTDLASWYNTLNKNQQTFVKTIAAITAAWWLLDAALDASPLGILAMLAGALFLLYDDWKTWKEGGKHLIDWDYWDPEVQKFYKVAKTIIGWIQDFVTAIGGWGTVFWTFATWLGSTWLLKVVGIFAKVALGLTATGAGSILGAIAVIMAALTTMIALSNAAGVKTIPFKGSPEEVNKDRLDTLSGGVVTPDTPPGAITANGGWGAFGGTRLGKWFRSKLPKALGGTSGNSVPFGGAGLGGSGPGGGYTVNSATQADLPPEAKAFLEQTASRESKGQYNVLYGGGTFSSYADHPRQEIALGNGKYTSAAGKYQFEKGTWDMAQKALNLPDFSPANQDRAAWWLAQKDYKRNSGGRDLDTDLQSKNYDTLAGVLNSLHSTWSSMNGGDSKQVAELAGRVRDALPNGHGPTPKASGKAPDTTGANMPAVGPGSPGYGINKPIPPNGLGTPASNQNNPISQTNHITVHGASDPHAAAKLVTTAQNRLNSDLVRNVQTRAV